MTWFHADGFIWWNICVNTKTFLGFSVWSDLQLLGSVRCFGVFNLQAERSCPPVRQHQLCRTDLWWPCSQLLPTAPAQRSAQQGCPAGINKVSASSTAAAYRRQEDGGRSGHKRHVFWAFLQFLCLYQLFLCVNIHIKQDHPDVPVCVCVCECTCMWHS